MVPRLSYPLSRDGFAVRTRRARGRNARNLPSAERRTRCALSVATEVKRAYRDFRFERGLVTYADQVALAAELMLATPAKGNREGGRR